MPRRLRLREPKDGDVVFTYTTRAGSWSVTFPGAQWVVETCHDGTVIDDHKAERILRDDLFEEVL
jgi:hypothetical protein